MAVETKEALARKFLSILGHPDAEIVRSAAVEDVVWSFPGRSRISGEAHGVDGVMKRAQIIASYGVEVAFIREVRGFAGVAAILHNTGEKNGKRLDEHVVGVFTFRDNKVSRLDTYLSDVGMAEDFFD